MKMITILRLEMDKCFFAQSEIMIMRGIGKELLGGVKRCIHCLLFMIS